MTVNQKHVLSLLLSGHKIFALGPKTFRVWDNKKNPVANCRPATFDWLKKWDLLRRKGQLYQLNRKTIRSLHGNSAIKRMYKGKQVKAGHRNPPPHKKPACATSEQSNKSFLMLKTLLFK